jgi:glycosyltransferase involved in cell wall biosynthesis
MAFELPESETLVLVPSYRHGKFLKERIDSILNQTYKDYHLLVIDDASPDNSAEILEQYRHNANVTIYCREKNSGSPFTAWGDALAQAKSEFIWIAESDDVAEPRFLERAVTSLKAGKNLSFYYCHSWIISEFGDIIGHTTAYLKTQFPKMNWSREQCISGIEFNNICQIFGQALPNMSSSVIKIDAFRKSFDKNFDRYRLAADWEFVARLASQGDVMFSPVSDNKFRKHTATSRASTALEQTCAEYFKAVSAIAELPGIATSNSDIAFKNCLHMFLHEKCDLKIFFEKSKKFGLLYNAGLCLKVLVFLLRDSDLRSRLKLYLNNPPLIPVS